MSGPDSSSTEEQAWLWAEFAEEPDLVSAVREYVHTGTAAIQDEDRCRSIVRAVLARLSKREVARRFHVGRNTINGIFAALEKAGKLSPLVDEFRDDLGQAAALAIRNLTERLEARQVPVHILPATVGILVQNFQLVSGNATQIVGKAVAEEATPEMARQLFEKLMAKQSGGAVTVDIGPVKQIEGAA